MGCEMMFDGKILQPQLLHGDASTHPNTRYIHPTATRSTKRTMYHTLPLRSLHSDVQHVQQHVHQSHVVEAQRYGQV